jgi:hypothetical protein
MARSIRLAPVALAIFFAGCSGSSGSSTVIPSGTPVIAMGNSGSVLSPTAYTQVLSTPAGNVVRFAVMFVQSDGSLVSAPSTINVRWSGPPVVVATGVDDAGNLLSDSGDDNPDASDVLPEAGATPTSFWLINPAHYTAAELAGVLFIPDPGSNGGGTITIAADLSGALTQHMVATVNVSGVPSGDIIRGQVVYISDKCIQCHGETGHGIEDAGPGINAEPGNVAADSAWTAGLMGSAVRGNISNRGMALNPVMLQWLSQDIEAQDFIDAYTWLKTQTH